VIPELEVEELPASTRGTVLLLLAACEQGRGCCFALGARGVRAEAGGGRAAQALASFLGSDGAVDPWLADQILLPLALAGETSSLRTGAVTRHLLTNAEVIRLFLPVKIQVDGALGGPATIQVRPGPGSATAPCTRAAAAPPEGSDRAESALLRETSMADRQR